MRVNLDLSLRWCCLYQRYDLHGLHVGIIESLRDAYEASYEEKGGWKEVTNDNINWVSLHMQLVTDGSLF